MIIPGVRRLIFAMFLSTADLVSDLKSSLPGVGEASDISDEDIFRPVLHPLEFYPQTNFIFEDSSFIDELVQQFWSQFPNTEESRSSIPEKIRFSSPISSLKEAFLGCYANVAAPVVSALNSASTPTIHSNDTALCEINFNTESYQLEIIWNNMCGNSTIILVLNLNRSAWSASVMRIINTLATTSAQYLIITDYCWWGFIRLGDSTYTKNVSAGPFEMKIHWMLYREVNPSVKEVTASIVRYNRHCPSSNILSLLDVHCKSMNFLARKLILVPRLNIELPMPPVSRKILAQNVQKLFCQRIFDLFFDNIEISGSGDSGTRTVRAEQFGELNAFQKTQSISLLKQELLAYSKLGQLQGNCVPYFLAFTITDPFAKWPSNKLIQSDREESSLIPFDTFYTSDLNSEYYRKPSILLESVDGFITFSEWAIKEKHSMPSSVYMTEQEIQQEICCRVRRSIQQIHSTGVAHGNIRGSHVLINEKDLSVIIVSFSHAVVDVKPSKLKRAQHADLNNIEKLISKLVMKRGI